MKRMKPACGLYRPGTSGAPPPASKCALAGCGPPSSHNGSVLGSVMTSGPQGACRHNLKFIHSANVVCKGFMCYTLWKKNLANRYIATGQISARISVLRV